MTDISDAYESAYTIMLNLNRSWIQKQGDFFVDSPIIYIVRVVESEMERIKNDPDLQYLIQQEK